MKLYDLNLLSAEVRAGGLWRACRRTVLSLGMLFLFAHTVAAQQSGITGVLTSSSGEPIIGATVVVRNSTVGAVTDASGRYTISASPTATLVFSSLGYESQTIQVNGRARIDVELASSSIGVDQVVVVGYGTQKKINLTGAVGSVDIRDIEGKPTVNVVESLQGTVPGLIITQPNSQPGSRPSLNVRGLNTINDNNPLVIIDGIQGDIQNVNQNDIEQISVLKDAASAAIYGSRASNGVILITTKKGAAGRSEVSYQFRYGLQQATGLPQVVDSWEYAELRNEALMNSGRAPEFTAEQIANFRYGDGANTSWIGELYRDFAPVQNHSVSISGGDDNTTYMVSAGYIDQKSLFHGDDFGMKKLNARINLSQQVFDRLKIDATMSFTRNEVRDHAYWTDWIIELADRTPPIYPIKDENGYNYPAGVGSNPLARLEKGGYSLTTQDDFNGTFRGELSLIDGLKLSGMVGARITNNRNHLNRIAIVEKTSTDLSNMMQETFGRTNDITTNLLLDYAKSCGKHNFAAMAGFAYEGNYDNDFRTDRSAADGDYPYNGDDVLGYNASVGSEMLRISNAGWASNTAIYSGLMRLNYNYDEKYLFEFNLRNDHSSKFAADNRSGWFPSLSAGWRLSEEGFFAPVTKVLPYVKLRGSWGLVGNDRIGNYRYLSTITSMPGYIIGGQVANIVSYSAANEAIRWEVTRMLDLGVDFSLFTDKLNVSFDYFDNNTRDILMNLPIPSTYGGGTPTQNAGVVRTQGWELNLTYDLKTGDFSHRISGNISDTRNEIVDIEGTETIAGNDPAWILKEGYPINAYYAYRWDGFFQNAEEVAAGPRSSFGAKPGDIRYHDKNGDGEINSADDRFVLGTRNPRYTFGFTYAVNWKGLDFSMFWQGVGKRNAWMRGEQVEAFHNGNTGPVFEFHKDRWTPTNTDATYPRLTTGSESANNALPSDFWIWDASYLRLKNLQVGYTLPRHITKKVFIEDLRVFVSGQNLLTFSKMNETGLDPELTEAARSFPVTRTFSIGLDVKF